MTTPGPRPPQTSTDHLVPAHLGDIGPEEFLEGMEFADLDLAEVNAAGATFMDSQLSRVSFGSQGTATDLCGVRFSGSVITDCRAETWNQPRGSLLNTEVSDTRIGAGIGYDAVWEKVRFANCRITYLNLRAAELKDVEFRDCVIDELDLDRATCTRVAFPGTRIGVLQVTGARLDAVDLRGLQPQRIDGIQSLRGATIDEHQLILLAELFAAELGVTVE